MRWFFFFFIVISLLVVAFTRNSPWPNEDLGAAKTAAKKDQRSVVAIVGAEWCKYCHQLEKKTLTDDRVAEALKKFHVVKIDADSEQGKAFSDKYRVQGLPTVVLMDANGTERNRIEGYAPPEDFLLLLKG